MRTAIDYPYYKDSPLRDHGNQNYTSLMSFMVDSWEALSTSTGSLLPVDFYFYFQWTSTSSGSRQGFPGVDHEGHQACVVLISVVTQRGILVVGIVYGCPYFKDPAIFSLVSKVPQVKKLFIPY